MKNVKCRLLKLVSATLMLSTMVMGSSINPASAYYAHWMARTTTQSCELGVFDVSYVTGTSGSPVTITSRADVYGPNSCANYVFVADPGTLTERQAVGLVNVNTGRYVECNSGVRIANDGYYAHSISTTWTTRVQDICGQQVCTYYLVKHYIYYLSLFNGQWVGAEFDDSPSWLCPTIP